MTPGKGGMTPRRTGAPERRNGPIIDDSLERSRREGSWGPPPVEVVEALRPWVDLDAIGPEEFYRWLGALALLLPSLHPGPGRAKDLDGRITELARALAKSSGAEAESHFRASEYFRENALLARRVKALEALLRTAKQMVPPSSPATEDAVEHYLPRGGSP